MISSTEATSTLFNLSWESPSNRTEIPFRTHLVATENTLLSVSYSAPMVKLESFGVSNVLRAKIACGPLAKLAPNAWRIPTV